MFGPCFVLQFLVSFLIILMGKRELFVLIQLSSRCFVVGSVLGYFCAVPWVVCSVSLAFPSHTHFLISYNSK